MEAQGDKMGAETLRHEIDGLLGSAKVRCVSAASPAFPSARSKLGEEALDRGGLRYGVSR